MSSLTDKNFDEKLDRLLKASVSPGAEPADLTVVIPPRHPKFSWVPYYGAAAAIAGMGILLFGLILAQPVGTDQGTAMPGHEISLLFSEGITIGVQSVSSPVFLMYSAVIMGCVYLFLTRRIMRLYRLH